MFALSAVLDPRGGGDGGSAPALTVRWSRGPAAARACAPDMADLRAAGARRLVLDLGAEPVDGDVAGLVAAASRVGLDVEVVAGAAAGWTEEAARRLRDAGLALAVVRVDTPPRPGRSPRARDAGRQAARAVEQALGAGLRTSVGFTLTQASTRQLPRILAWVERVGAHGCDVAHVMPDGRLDWRARLARPAQTRFALQTMAAAAWGWRRRRLPLRIRTWHGPVDPVFIYIWCLRHAPGQAPAALRAARAKAEAWPDLAWIDACGNVSAVAGVTGLALGSLRRRPFSELWLQRELAGWQRTRALHAAVGAHCAGCRWYPFCRGGERARAMTGDSLEGPDPGCCLTAREMAPAGAAAG